MLLIKSLRELIKKNSKDKPTKDTNITDQTALKALEHFEDRMKRVSEESNKFANQYRFGGIVAVIALLNADLLLDNSILNFDWGFSNISQGLVLLTVLVLVYLMSRVYFSAIDERIARFDQAYRKTKHKYEILFNGIMLRADPKELLEALDHKALPAQTELTFPEDPRFVTVAAYLHDHHGRQMPGEKAATLEAKLASIIVNLAIFIKLLTYLLIILK
jgi:hypothetical protein